MGRLKKVDPKKELEGVWCRYSEDELDADGNIVVHGTEVLLARMHNEQFTAEMEKQTKPFLSMVRSGDMPAATQRKILKRAAAKTIILGWRNLELDETGEVAYSPEKALEVISTAGYRDFWNWCLARASEQANYLAEMEKEAAGN